MYAICRIAKLKSYAEIAASYGHVLRTRETLNADPSRKIHQLIGDPNKQLVEVIKEKIPKKHRKDAVLCVEIFLSASPEYFRPDNPSLAGEYDLKLTNDWIAENYAWLKEAYGDIVVSAVAHLDEITPHIHAHLIPLTQSGGLSCKLLFGGREKLQALQDNYASRMSNLGLQRGIRGSKATHREIARYYGHVKDATQVAEVRVDLPKLENFKMLGQEEVANYHAQVENEVKSLLEIIQTQSEMVKAKTQEISRLREELKLVRQLASELSEVNEIGQAVR